MTLDAAFAELNRVSTERLRAPGYSLWRSDAQLNALLKAPWAARPVGVRPMARRMLSPSGMKRDGAAFLVLA